MTLPPVCIVAVPLILLGCSCFLVLLLVLLKEACREITGDSSVCRAPLTCSLGHWGNGAWQTYLTSNNGIISMRANNLYSVALHLTDTLSCCYVKDFSSRSARDIVRLKSSCSTGLQQRRENADCFLIVYNKNWMLWTVNQRRYHHSMQLRWELSYSNFLDACISSLSACNTVAWADTLTLAE